ncbi:MAG: transposase family protein [Eubacterium sp.]|nr:transposase family protein [Eubacterium sp.]
MKKALKRFISILAIISLIFSICSMFSSCNTDEVIDDEDYVDYQEENTDADNYDLSLTIGDYNYNLPVMWSDFENDGWTFTNRNVGVGASGVNGYHYDSIDNNIISVEADNDSMYLSDIDLNLCNFKKATAQWEDCQVAGMDISLSDLNDVTLVVGGITLGLTTQYEVEEMYGSAAEGSNSGYKYYLMEYGNEENKMIVYYDDTNVVYRINFVNIVCNKFIDDSELVELGSEYNVVPDYLSDDPFDYQFEINGDLYQIPVTPQAFLDNDGYSANDDELDQIVSSHSNATVSITYDGRTTSLTVCNFTENAIKARNCPIKEIHMGYNCGAFRDFRIFNGFTYGTAEEDFMDYIHSLPNQDYIYDNTILSPQFDEDIKWTYSFSDSDRLKDVSIYTTYNYYKNDLQVKN